MYLFSDCSLLIMAICAPTLEYQNPVANERLNKIYAGSSKFYLVLEVGVSFTDKFLDHPVVLQHLQKFVYLFAQLNQILTFAV